MTRSIRRTALPLVLALVVPLALAACSASGLPTRPSPLGVPVTGDRLLALAATPGPVRLERVVAARWQVPRSGLLDLDHPAARAAGIEDGPESIDLPVFVIDHPEHGRWLVDSGVAGALDGDGLARHVALPVRLAMDVEALDVRVRTRTLDTRQDPVAGVLLTHVHLDHVLGLPDLDPSVRVVVGPGELAARSVQHAATRGTTDRLLGRTPETLAFEPDPDERFAGVLDLFGDGSVLALHVPGHTPGSTAFLVRAVDGVHLITGDASHTAWGWENGVPPGTYSLDGARGADSLARLRALVDAVPGIRVHPGHQSLDAGGRT
jgi:glyoxylase-like metal-dependent hydrolase (beta-lactamase superfamily II)